MFILGDVTLPNPVSFTRNIVEKQSWNETLTGYTKRNIVNRKEEFVLDFKDLTQAEANAIVSEFILDSVSNFSVSETNLTIDNTPVLVSVIDREYKKGPDYRQDLTLILLEVK